MTDIEALRALLNPTPFPPFPISREDRARAFAAFVEELMPEADATVLQVASDESWCVWIRRPDGEWKHVAF